MIFFAINYKSQIIGIVNATEEAMAVAYWQGQRLEVHAVRSEQDLPIAEGYHVRPIMSTSARSALDFQNVKVQLGAPKDIITVNPSNM